MEICSTNVETMEQKQENDKNLLNTTTTTINNQSNLGDEVLNIANKTISEHIELEKDENVVVNNDNGSDSDNDNVHVGIRKKPQILIDSDSESDDNVNKLQRENVEMQKMDVGVVKRKKIAIVDSDSDDEITPHNKSFNDENDSNAPPPVIYNIDSNGQLIVEDSAANYQKSRLANLCDTDSSEDESNDPVPDNTKKSTVKNKRPLPSKKVKENNIETKDPKKMTGREAAEQRKEIQAESQRMLRESKVSLPYHIPKSYSLKEFLAKRSKLSPISISTKSPAPVAIKMPLAQLKIISKKIDERMKEVEEFYKSESESDDEEEKKTKQEGIETNKEMNNWLYNIVDIAIEQVESRNDVKNLLNVLVDNAVTLSEGIDLAALSPINSMDVDIPEPDTIEYEFNLDDMDMDMDEETSPPQPNKQKASVAELLKEKLGDFQPKLSGGPNEVIDLDSGVSEPSQVRKLVEKYIEHTTNKPMHRDKVETSVICLSGGDIHQETIAMNVIKDDDCAAGAVMEVPGAKLRKLRAELENQMAQRRSKLWVEKSSSAGTTSKIENDDDNNEEGVKSDYEEDILDDEEEEELTESSADEDDDDIEEEDEKSEKNRVKSAFVDDEAEVSEIEDDDPESIHNDNEVADDDDNNIDEDEVDRTQTGMRSLKRIVRGFNEDSDDENDHTTISKTEEVNSVKTPADDNTDNSEALNVSVEEDRLPPNLPNLNKTPQPPNRHKSDLDFLTPVTFLTGLQNLNADNTKLKESPTVPSPLQFSSQPSPLKDDGVRQQHLHKKLFDEPLLSSQSQLEQNMKELTEVCSGQFPETQPQTSAEEVPTTQDLLDVCSGDFNQKSVNIVINDNNKEIKELDEEQDQMISQLLNEESLKEFEKKLHDDMGVVEEIKATGIIDSDDEDGLEIKHKKLAKKIIFSDDSSSDEYDDGDEDDEEVEEEIGLRDTIDEEQVNYDSEENEVENPKKFQLADFVEKEAELSESEWGSEDEDEHDLDQLEMEQGDLEKYDENQLRTDIERIHMRKILDDDDREVKLLQELLLEDGEMHGAGRQRQFRWRNIDANDNDENVKRDNDDEDIYLDDDESEEQFRRMRYKREMFLKMKTTTEDVETILQESAVLRVGQKAIRRSQSLNLSGAAKEVQKIDEVVIAEPFRLVNKRGSFLSRGEQVLQRLAEYNKVSTTVVNASTVKTNRRSFVFQTVSTNEMINNQDNKRKASNHTPQAVKKIRLTENFISPAANKTFEAKPSGSKKLF